MTNDTAKAVMKATRLIPWEPCAVPSPPAVVSEGLADDVADAVPVVEDMMGKLLKCPLYRDMGGCVGLGNNARRRKAISLGSRVRVQLGRINFDADMKKWLLKRKVVNHPHIWICCWFV